MSPVVSWVKKPGGSALDRRRIEILAEKGLIDEYEVYLNPLVWGEGNVHLLGDRGTVRMELDDVKRFDSGVVLLTYLPAS